MQADPALVAIALGYAWWTARDLHRRQVAGTWAATATPPACNVDQTVHADGLRLRRRRDGRLGRNAADPLPRFRGRSRSAHVGRLVLMGDELVSFTGPNAVDHGGDAALIISAYRKGATFP